MGEILLHGIRSNEPLMIALFVFAFSGLAGLRGAEGQHSAEWRKGVAVIERALAVDQWEMTPDIYPPKIREAIEQVRSSPRIYADILDVMLALPGDLSQRAESDERGDMDVPHPRLIMLATHLGPEHGARVLREFEAVLRTRIEDQGWVAIVAYEQGVSAKEIKEKKLGVHRALPKLHGAVIDALAELGDTSLVRYVARALAGDARGGSGGRAYLLRAVRAGDAEARRWLEYLLENHPNAFPDARAGGSAAIHEWGRKAREALAAGEAVGRPEGEASSAGSDIDDADDADAGEAGAAP